MCSRLEITVNQAVYGVPWQAGRLPCAHFGPLWSEPEMSHPPMNTNTPCVARNERVRAFLLRGVLAPLESQGAVCTREHAKTALAVHIVQGRSGASAGYLALAHAPACAHRMLWAETKRKNTKKVPKPPLKRTFKGST